MRKALSLQGSRAGKSSGQRPHAQKISGLLHLAPVLLPPLFPRPLGPRSSFLTFPLLLFSLPASPCLASSLKPRSQTPY